MTAILKHPNALYIGAEWVGVVDVEEIINPATEEVIGLAPVGDFATVDAAIAAAREAFDRGPWPRMAARDRKIRLQAFLDALGRRKDQIQALIVSEAGAVRRLAETVQWATPMKHAQFFIDICERAVETSLPVEVHPGPGGAKVLGSGVVIREPVGVVSAITPYNFPYFMNISKVFPALAVGCTVILKPSPYTPFEALILGEAADEAGLPKGVLNIVTGGKAVGELLTSDERVDLVTFTGSDVVGAAIQAQAAPTLKRVVMELGGKSAMIVRPDANLQAAALSGLNGFTVHCGQGCNLLTRHIVHNSVRAQYVETVGSMAKALKIGDPTDPSVQIGPLIRETQRKRTEDYVEVALGEGARLAAGGRRPDGFQKGFYYEPTLFTDVENRFRIAQEEVFGPIGVVIGYDTDEEALALANDSRFGLSGAIFSADVGRAYEMAREIRTGGVAINGGAGGANSWAPFGGVKRSGYGREYGYEGLNEFTYTKVVSYRGG